LPVLFVHCEAGQDARELLTRRRRRRAATQGVALPFKKNAGDAGVLRFKGPANGRRYRLRWGFDDRTRQARTGVAGRLGVV
ncbi:hypothetical protein, partial [Stenotrophomonas sp. SrG]|uniref:hypothetical protein n=1 Tax=Stenotrophomonas sp. SrG TaxID=3414430 RepID=UPI003CFBB4A0